MGAAGHRRLRPRPQRFTAAPSICSRKPATCCKAQRLVHRATGRPFGFEILTTTRDQERLALAFTRNLKRAGIDARVRNIDATQFERRRITFDFDMMDYRWEQSLSPGNEQLFYWGSEAADQQGSRNYMGVKSKAIDAMIAAMLQRHRTAEISSPPPARSTACCCPASMWYRFISRRDNGWRAGRESSIP